jgi:hypothetical protein
MKGFFIKLVISRKIIPYDSLPYLVTVFKDDYQLKKAPTHGAFFRISRNLCSSI